MAKEAEAKPAPKKGGKDPFVQVTPLKDVFYLFADRKTKLLPLSDVAYVLRASGLTIYVEDEKKIKAEVEKIDGLGKPVSFQTLKDWVDEKSKDYVRSYDDAYNSLVTLCHEGIIGNKSYVIKVPHLRHLVSEVGDKLKPEAFDKILRGTENVQGSGVSGDAVPLDEFLSFLQK